ncbi:C2H2 type zinc finger domain protein [Colletotrichum sojae]|uniref:C2H2 type zinc finger domain protein n=1 Tax=Colletotrichum sojae TaxID=2175907 RepID=A0A8H6JGJ3_9PEZI|nr:C2H2 type zinc finger domain protein [Colletotrichum sojae]
MKRSREVEEESSAGRDAAGDQTSSRTIDADDRSTKFAELEPSVDEPLGDIAMKCFLPPHREALSFKSYGEYEAHYIKAHTNRCIECGRNLPSEHLLNVHHEECHDSIAAVRRERGERTYSCFVESCERKCMTPQKRRMHLIDKHMYPKNFFFAVTREGIDGRRSLLVEGGHHRRTSSSVKVKDSKRKSSLQDPSSSKGQSQQSAEDHEKNDDGASAQKQDASTKPTAQHAPTERPDTEMEDLAGAMSALQFVPNSVRFGRGGGRAGFAKR